MQDKKTEEQETKLEIIKKIKELDNTADKIKTVALNHYLDKKKEIDNEMEKEMKALTLKYDKLSQPIYDSAAEIITGKRAVTDEEIEAVKDVLSEEEQKTLEENKSNSDAIKGYWLKAAKNSDMILPEIKEKDEAILEHITNIQYLPNLENPLEFQVIFSFSENEYFENDKLTKSFVLKDDDEPLEGKGTEIEWKTGKNVTVKTVKKTQKNKKSGAKRVVSKEVADESFFNFFKDHVAGGDEEVDEDDEEAMQEEELLAIDFDIARSLIDEVIPYSLEYYLGVKTPEDGDFDYPGMDDDEDDDDEDEEEDQQKKSKKKAHKKSSDSAKSNEGKGGKAEEKPECKQQ